MELGSGDGVRGCGVRGSLSPPPLLISHRAQGRDQQAAVRGMGEVRQEEETDSFQTQEAPSLSRWENHALALSSTRGLSPNPCGNE